MEERDEAIVIPPTKSPLAGDFGEGKNNAD